MGLSLVVYGQAPLACTCQILFRIQAVYCLYGDPWNGVSIPINVLKTSLSRCVSCINNTYSADTGRRIVKIPKSGGLRTVQS